MEQGSGYRSALGADAGVDVDAHGEEGWGPREECVVLLCGWVWRVRVCPCSSGGWPNGRKEGGVNERE